MCQVFLFFCRFESSCVGLQFFFISYSISSLTEDAQAVTQPVGRLATNHCNSVDSNALNLKKEYSFVLAF